jgi:hypothetical protein
MTHEDEKIEKIINDFKSSSNKDLILVMNHLEEDFKETKDLIINLTYHLDKIEMTYNNILSEFQNRNKINGK